MSKPDRREAHWRSEHNWEAVEKHYIVGNYYRKWRWAKVHRAAAKAVLRDELIDLQTEGEIT